MYLARFSTDVGDWVQVAVGIDSAPAHHDGPGSVFWDEIARRLAAAARISRGTVARRVSVDGRGRLRQTIAVTAPAGQERGIRQVVAGLTRLERVIGGSLTLPQRPEEHDGLLEHPGRLQLCSTAEGFSVRGVRLACDFRLAAALDDLLLDACLGGYALTYQLHVRAAEIDPEWLRAVRKNVLALRDLPGARPVLVARQEELARAFGHASAFCEELLAVDSPDAVESTTALLADRFRASHGPLGFPAPPVRFRDGAYDEPLAVAVHSHDLDPLAPADLCGTAVDALERDRLLGWRPSARVLRLLTSARLEGSGAEAEEAPPDRVSAVEPYQGDGPFVFLSYKRQDLPRIAPILDMMRELGVPVWYDRGIPGGAEWDEVIESRVANARFVLFCVSRAAVKSKYVRREVKFADALNVPLLCVLLEDEVSLEHGLRMLLMQYQMLASGSADFAERLRLAVERLA